MYAIRIGELRVRAMELSMWDGSDWGSFVSKLPLKIIGTEGKKCVSHKHIYI